MISKVTFLNNIPFKILFQFINNNEYLLLIKVYNQTDLKCVKEIMISHEKFVKIVSKIKIEEILPKNVFCSFINSHEIFTDKILSHTSYLFQSKQSLQIGLSPGAVGLLFFKKYTFDFLDSKTATVDFIILKKMHLRMLIINDIVE